MDVRALRDTALLSLAARADTINLADLKQNVFYCKLHVRACEVRSQYRMIRMACQRTGRHTKCCPRSVLTACSPSSVHTIAFTEPGPVVMGVGAAPPGLHSSTAVSGAAAPGGASLLSQTARICLEFALQAIVATAPEPHATIDCRCRERVSRSTCMPCDHQ